MSSLAFSLLGAETLTGGRVTSLRVPGMMKLPLTTNMRLPVFMIDLRCGTLTFLAFCEWVAFSGEGIRIQRNSRLRRAVWHEPSPQRSWDYLPQSTTVL